MPPKKRKLCVKKDHGAAKRVAKHKSQETEQARRVRLAQMNNHASTSREHESEQARRVRLAQKSSHASASREHESEQARRVRLAQMNSHASTSRDQETPVDRRSRLSAQRITSALNRDQISKMFHKAAFLYEPRKYDNCNLVNIGGLNQTCEHCQAMKFPKESPGLCCSNGKVRLPFLEDPPLNLKDLFLGQTDDSKHFLKNLRRYNSAFQMTSFKANIIHERGFMPTFKVQGQVYHQLGPLLPTDNSPKFLQVYFVGDEAEQAQIRASNIPGVQNHIIAILQTILRDHNSYAISFKHALELNPITTLDLHIDADKRPSETHSGRFNAPQCNEVAIVMVGEEYGKRDIVLRPRHENNMLKNIADTHRSYDALQYPIPLIYGEDGYHFGIPLHGPGFKTVSCMSFYCYMFMLRSSKFNILHHCRELFHQYAVDMYAKVESERLTYIRCHQTQLRAECYSHLRDSINNDVSVQNIGQLCILPSSFTGSPRYMHERTQDAMTYVRLYGKPDLFITFTCNPKWPEISNSLLPNQSDIHRHDITARVFHLKLKKLTTLLKVEEIFGKIQAHMYTIEWQKRGLPHAHILLWLKEKLHSNDIDKIITAELPNPTADPNLFEVVNSSMIHGPCGTNNPNSPCMKNGSCSKEFPKQFLSNTESSEDGYPKYRRRHPDDGGITYINSKGVTIDNRWVVPHCPMLIALFNAHINVEFCNSVKSIKYICKYINKGTDAAAFGLRHGEAQDEVTQYLHGRYISSNEAFWRIFSFPIHERYPSIMQLAVHLENGQRVYFTRDNAADKVLNPKPTTLTAFFELNGNDEFASSLLYHQVPTYYTWKDGKWARRKKGTPVDGESGIREDNTLGRVYTVHPRHTECFFLRILLFHVVGPTSFQALKSVGQHVCATYREACQLRGLLENDRQWVMTIEEAVVSRIPSSLRLLFATVITLSEVADPLHLWNLFCKDISEDFLKKEAEDISYNLALCEIEDFILKMGGKCLEDYGLPAAQRNRPLKTESDQELMYDSDVLGNFVTSHLPSLQPEQRHAFDVVLQDVLDCGGGLFFLDAPGGTGKTHLTTIILAEVRRRKFIAVASASSGIAATLLPGGKTAHSAFALPLDLSNPSPVCRISKTSGKAKMLQQCRLIVWDECTMANKMTVNALDRTLKDLKNNMSPMGGVTVLFSGDFRQTLPVIQRGTRSDEVKACLKSSHIWSHIKVLKLTKNMRSLLAGRLDCENFSQQLLKIGEGNVLLDNDMKINVTSIGNAALSVPDLIERVYPNIVVNMQDPAWLSERCILAPTNNSVAKINSCILAGCDGVSQTFMSIDSVVEESEAVNYPIEFLNSLTIPGFPDHNLEVKVGVPMMLMRNLQPPKLCNGTRLIVSRCCGNLIEAVILTGVGRGETVFIPRLPLISIDSALPIQFRRLQFPLKLCFAMTINKSQGQTLRVCGVYLEDNIFSHGQFYVACSRVGSRNDLFIYSQDGRTNNVVYKEVL